MSVQISIENVAPVSVSISEDSVPITVESSDSRSISVSSKENFELTTSVAQSFSFLVSDPESSLSVGKVSSIAIELDGKSGVVPKEVALKSFSTTSAVPRSGDPFLFFVADDDGNGPAIGFWDGTDIQICVSLTI